MGGNAYLAPATPEGGHYSSSPHRMRTYPDTLSPWRMALRSSLCFSATVTNILTGSVRGLAMAGRPGRRFAGGAFGMGRILPQDIFPVNRFILDGNKPVRRMYFVGGN